MNINKAKLKMLACTALKWSAFVVGLLALLAFMQFVVLVLLMAGYL